MTQNHTHEPRLASVRRFALAHPDALALGLIVLLSVALRLAFFFLAPVFVHGDSFQYYSPAQRLFSGRGFPLLLKHPPVYPLFLVAVATTLGDALRNVVAVQSIIGTGSVMLAYGVGRLTLGRGAAIVAGLATAISGNLLVFEHYIMSETIFTFAITLAALLFLLGLKRGHWAWFAGCGLVIGIAALTRPHGQLLPALLLPIAALHYRHWRPLLRAAVPLLAAMALVVLPWMVRNHQVHDSFTVAGRIGQSLAGPTVFQHPGAFVFFDPTNPPPPEPHKRYRARQIIQEVVDMKIKEPDLEMSPISVHDLLRRRLKLDEAEADELLRDAIVSVIREDPGTYARLALGDTWGVFTGRPIDFREIWKRAMPGDEPARLTEMMRKPTPEQRQWYPLTERLAELYESAKLGPVLPLLFFLGLVASAARPAWRLALVPGLVVLGLTLATSLIAGVGQRYHYPQDPMLHVVAWGGVLTLRDGMLTVARRLRRPRTLPERSTGFRVPTGG